MREQKSVKLDNKLKMSSKKKTHGPLGLAETHVYHSTCGKIQKSKTKQLESNYVEDVAAAWQTSSPARSWPTCGAGCASLLILYDNRRSTERQLVV